MGLLVASVTLAVPLTAMAQAELDFSEPSDGEEVPGPLIEVIVGFTESVTPVGFGFEVVDEAGASLIPEVESADDTVFTLTFETPFDEGELTVHYEVMTDADITSGTITFVVGAPAVDPATTTSEDSNASGEGTTIPTSNIEPATDIESEDPGEAAGEDSGSNLGTIVLAIAATLVVTAGVLVLMRSRQSPD